MESAPDTDSEPSVSSQSVRRYLTVSLFGFLLVALGLAIQFHGPDWVGLYPNGSPPDEPDQGRLDLVQDQTRQDLNAL